MKILRDASQFLYPVHWRRTAQRPGFITARQPTLQTTNNGVCHEPNFTRLLTSGEIFHSMVTFDPHTNVYPVPDDVKNNNTINLKAVTIPTSNGDLLKGFLLEQKTPSPFLNIYLQGRSHNVAYWLSDCNRIASNTGVNVLAVDYRGYGQSTGYPTIKGVISDAQSMYAYAKSLGFKHENISITGHSLGCAIGLELAKRERIKRVLLIGPFTDLLDVTQNIAQWVYYTPLRWFLKNDVFNNRENLRVLAKDTKLIILHGGERDQKTPPHFQIELEQIAQAAGLNIQRIAVSRAGHNNTLKLLPDYTPIKKLFTQ